MTVENASTPETGMSDKATEAGTTAKLFPEFSADAGHQPEEEKQAEPVQEEKATKEPDEEPEKKDTPAPKYLTPEEHGDEMVKVKIDGKEMDVPFRDLLRGYQTDQHLTQKGQKIAQEKQTLEEIKRQFGDKTPAQPATPEEVDPLTAILQPYIVPFQQKIADLEKKLENVSVVTAPAQYQANLKRLDGTLKGQGFDDFMAYVPKIENYVKSLPEEDQPKYDNSIAFIDLYKTMKLKDTMSGNGKPPKGPDERPTPPVVKIEPANGTPGDTGEYQAKYKAAFDTARETGDWSEVLRLKGAI